MRTSGQNPRVKRRFQPTEVLQDTIKNLWLAAFLIIALLFVGTFGYVLFEGWSAFDALYMTVITIATVGFREVHENMSHSGRIFTMIIIFLGISVGGYTIARISALLIEGKFLDIVKGRKMEKEITGLANHIIVCGYGKIGEEVCRVLAEMGKPFIVIDKDLDKIDRALGEGIIAAVGEATDDDILIKAGIKNAYGLISAVSDDSANVYLVLTARALNDKLRIIARGVDENSRKKMERAGADKVVSPFEIGARRMAALMTSPDILDFIDALAPGTSYGLRLERIELKKSSRLIGKRLDESYIKRDTEGALILGIEKPGQKPQFNPPGATVLQADDVMFAIGNDEQLKQLGKLAV
jgi:voltage-gated potassium channel